MKILVIRFSSIGDIVLTTPVVRCLKTQLKQAEIHYLTKEPYKELLQSNPYISKIYTIKKSVHEILSQLKKEKYDYIVDLHHNIRSLVVKSSLGKKSASFKKLNIEKWLSVNFKLKMLPSVHIVDRYLKTVEKLKVINDHKGLDFFIAIPEEPILKLLPATHKNYIVFAIGAKFATKKLPNEKIIEVLKKIKRPVVLIGGKEDMANAEIIMKESSSNIINLCGKLSLQQSAVILKHSSAVITHDSGMMHTAAAFKKKIISVWGNTVPAFGMYPYLAHPDSRIVEVKNLSCRPCSKIGFSKCPKKHFKCMNGIKVEEIVMGTSNN